MQEELHIVAADNLAEDSLVVGNLVAEDNSAADNLLAEDILVADMPAEDNLVEVALDRQGWLETGPATAEQDGLAQKCAGR